MRGIIRNVAILFFIVDVAGGLCYVTFFFITNYIITNTFFQVIKVIDIAY